MTNRYLELKGKHAEIEEGKGYICSSQRGERREVEESRG